MHWLSRSAVPRILIALGQMRVGDMVSQKNYFSPWLILCVVWVAAALLLAGAASAQPTADTEVDKESEAAAENLKVLQAIFELPEDEIDLAKVKLIIDRMIDPQVDVEHTLEQIDAMASALRQQLPFSARSHERLELLRQYLYQSGPWNKSRPFSYDLMDPLGRNLNNKLLTTYLATRKGNCVSMPALFIILGQRIGLDVTAAIAPEHIFVKYRDETGNLYNLETTSGAGFTRDVWIRQNMPMTDEAIAKGTYMRSLTKKETAVLMADTLNEFYAARHQELERAYLAQLQLKHYPTLITAVLHLASVYVRTLNSYGPMMLYTSALQPAQAHEIYVQLQKKLDYWHAQAVALGWQPAAEALEAANLSVDKQKLSNPK